MREMDVPRTPKTRRLSTLVTSAIALALVVSAARTFAAEQSFLWRASNARGALYLVGSVHMLTKDYYPLSPALEAAFKDSDLLVEEVDLAVGFPVVPDLVPRPELERGDGERP